MCRALALDKALHHLEGEGVDVVVRYPPGSAAVFGVTAQFGIVQVGEAAPDAATE